MNEDNRDIHRLSDGRDKLSKSFRDNIIQALEELRLKRQLEVTNTERINELLREKFELGRQKDELACKWQKEIDSLAQKLADSQKELYETKEKLSSLKKKEKSTEHYENEGVKVLKEEIISLELAKHNLEKKLKDQDYQNNLQSTAKENVIKQLKSLQDRITSVENQRDRTQHELMNIESAVQKAKLFQNRILGVNKHQQCSLEKLKSDFSIANEELLKARVTIHKFNHDIQRFEEKESYSDSRKALEPRQDLVKEKLEEQVDQLKKENDKLLQELNKQTDLSNKLNNRLVAISTSEMSLHFVIDDLKAENAKLIHRNDRADYVDKGVQTTAESTEVNEDEENRTQEDGMSRGSLPQNTPCQMAECAVEEVKMSQEIPVDSQTIVKENERASSAVELFVSC